MWQSLLLPLGVVLIGLGWLIGSRLGQVLGVIGVALGLAAMVLVLGAV
jgi:hypothetical protein